MNESKAVKRGYSSSVRAEAADETRSRILSSARALFGDQGIEAVTIAEIARSSQVSASTVYAVFTSKEGILRGLMEQALFGGQYQSAQQILAGVVDPVEAIALTARIARSIYESESSELGPLRNVSGYAPALQKIEEEFEQARYNMQHERVRQLFAAGRAKQGLTMEEARRILWMYTSRDVYRMLVVNGGWTHDRFEEWLSNTLVEALAGSN
ncbi:MAG: TetR/AcrR family transcriptional regulator [Sphingomonadales bacterium]|nr:MAG: TetR/AcrR family transcriptional regulator [Sphingomonadales bacterium]